MRRNFFRDIDWKGVLKACIEILRSIGRGDFLIRMRVDKLFPYILYTVFIGILSIWLSYQAEKTMHKVEVNKEKIESLKYAHANKTCEIIGLSRISTVEKLLEESGSELRIPETPAYTIKK
ncbi:MAG: hypothetical protein E7116_04690 [Bacteroidales bacterium]|nr:hypothetical protein [Bacteroidales bacterium]